MKPSAPSSAAAPPAARRLEMRGQRPGDAGRAPDRWTTTSPFTSRPAKSSWDTSGTAAHSPRTRAARPQRGRGRYACRTWPRRRARPAPPCRTNQRQARLRLDDAARLEGDRLQESLGAGRLKTCILKWVATYSAALRCSGLPVSRPRMASLASASTCANQRTASSAADGFVASALADAPGDGDEQPPRSAAETRADAANQRGMRMIRTPHDESSTGRRLPRLGH